MNLRTKISLLALAALSSASGCSFFTKLLGAGGASDASAFTVDMERYDVKKIDLRPADVRDAICPGASVTFKIVATAIDKKKNAETLLETAAPGGSSADARGKMDLTEFAMAARGGQIENGVFSTVGDPFQVLLGFDVKATYRLDKAVEVTKHYAPEYSCFRGVGGAGSSGNSGSSGNTGSQNGGAGGAGGPGGAGSPGPQIAAFATIVETPLYEKVGLIRVTGGREQLSLFDLSAGITVSAQGGSGGSGGWGGQGGRGADGGGTGGPGGPGGDGGPGADGGQVLLTIDSRYPELKDVIGINVAGGAPGGGGSGGRGGQGGTALANCSACKPGVDGPGGPDGVSGSIGGRDGTAEVRTADVTSVFAELPPGIRLRDDAQPAPVAAPEPPPPEPPTRGKRKKSAA